MSRTRFFLVLLVFCLCISCKQDSLVFRYTEKPELFKCDLENTEIFKEALYSFENDLVSYYKASDTIEKAYEVFINSSEGHTLNRVEFISDHTISVFRELKKIDSLWLTKDSENLMFNYNHPIFECIEESIQNEEFKKTFKVLRENNSLSPKLVISVIRDRDISRTASNDKALALIISLDYCFHQMTHMFIPKAEY